MELVIGVLACWRVSLLLTQETGPWEILARLRDRVGVHYNEYHECEGTNELAKALCCVYCTSVWVSVILTVGMRLPWLYWLAIAGGAALLQKWTEAKE